jgi:actin-related protein
LIKPLFQIAAQSVVVTKVPPSRPPPPLPMQHHQQQQQQQQQHQIVHPIAQKPPTPPPRAYQVLQQQQQQQQQQQRPAFPSHQTPAQPQAQSSPFQPPLAADEADSNPHPKQVNPGVNFLIFFDFVNDFPAK